MSKCIPLVFLFLVPFGIVPWNAQSVRCDNGCVSTIRVLLKEQKQKIGTSFYEKANRRLGDSVSVGIQKIFPKKSILSSENVKLFLPIIREAFNDRAMILELENTKPTVTLELLNYLKGKVSNPSLRKDIIDSINEIVDYLGDNSQGRFNAARVEPMSNFSFSGTTTSLRSTGYVRRVSLRFSLLRGPLDR